MTDLLSFQIRTNQVMSSTGPSWIHIEFNQFELRITQALSSRHPGWFHIKFDELSLKNQ